MTLSELKKLAQSATPGPWKTTPGEYDSSSEGQTFQINPMGLKGEDGKSLFSLDCGDFQALQDNDTRFIAAMNPSTALRMIELLERAKKEFELMCAYFEHDRQVVLHKNDIVPDAKKWLKDLEEL